VPVCLISFVYFWRPIDTQNYKINLILWHEGKPYDSWISAGTGNPNLACPKHSVFIISLSPASHIVEHNHECKNLKWLLLVDPISLHGEKVLTWSLYVENFFPFHKKMLWLSPRFLPAKIYLIVKSIYLLLPISKHTWWQLRLPQTSCIKQWSAWMSSHPFLIPYSLWLQNLEGACRVFWESKI